MASIINLLQKNLNLKVKPLSMVNMWMLLMVENFNNQSCNRWKIMWSCKCNHKDVDLAVKASRKAFNSGVWSRSAPEHRKRSVIKICWVIKKHGTENSVLECVDSGKLIADCIKRLLTMLQCTFNGMEN